MPSATPTAGNDQGRHKYGLPHRARLITRHDFRRVYSRGLRVRSKHLVLVAWRRRRPGHRLGLAVSKEHGAAVRRNKIKRIFREAFRLCRPELAGNYDMVMIPQKVEGKYHLDLVQAELSHLVGQLEAGKGRRRSQRASQRASQQGSS